MVSARGFPSSPIQVATMSSTRWVPHPGRVWRLAPILSPVSLRRARPRGRFTRMGRQEGQFCSRS